MQKGIKPTLPGPRVLVVEDEYLIAMEIRELLEKMGAEVVGPFPDESKALAALEVLPQLDYAILDINLRGKPSFAVARKLRALNVPFVFCTGYAEAAIPDPFRDVPRWQKPLETASFERWLLSALQRP